MARQKPAGEPATGQNTKPNPGLAKKLMQRRPQKPKTLKSSGTKGRQNELILACHSWQQAQQATENLLAEKLITAAEYLPAKGGAGKNGIPDALLPVKLIMRAARADAARIETALAALFGHQAFASGTMPELEQN